MEKDIVLPEIKGFSGEANQKKVNFIFQNFDKLFDLYYFVFIVAYQSIHHSASLTSIIISLDKVDYNSLKQHFEKEVCCDAMVFNLIYALQKSKKGGE